MANRTLSGVTILIRNDTAANWIIVNPVLSKGEFGVEIDTKKFKIGDGIKTWSQLDYSGTSVQASATNGHLIIDGSDVAVYTLPNNVPLLDANGKLDASVLPPLAIGTAVTVADDTARFALTTATVQNGDVVNVAATSKSYFVVDDTKLNLEAGYSQILTPAAAVLSVNNKTGVVVLTSDDVGEGSTNLYWTSSRFDTAFAAKASTGLTDGTTIVHSDDTLVLDCGAADRS